MGITHREGKNDFGRHPSTWTEDEVVHDSPKFLHLLEVFVDDFIQLAQTDDIPTQRGLSRKLMTAIHDTFPPPDVSGHNGKDPISMKKLREGEGLWETKKEILGWIFDGVTRCIELKASHAKKIQEELTAVAKQSSVEWK